MKDPQVGDLLPNGYTVEARYRDWYVLCVNPTPGVPEPYAIWNLDKDGHTNCGRYFASPEDAEMIYADLCFNWYDPETATGLPDHRLRWHDEVAKLDLIRATLIGSSPKKRNELLQKLKIRSRGYANLP